MTDEQRARDLLDRLGVEDAQSSAAGDLVELASALDAVRTAARPRRDDRDARDTSMDAIRHAVGAAEQAKGMVYELLKALAAERDALQAENALLKKSLTMLAEGATTPRLRLADDQ